MYILPKEGGWKRELSFYGVYFLGKENFRTGEDEIHKHIFQITCGSKLVGIEAQ